MYFFVMGPKGSGKTTVAKALQKVLLKTENRKRFMHDGVVKYYHFPTNPPPDDMGNPYLHFLHDFDRVGKELHEAVKRSWQKFFIYDRSFVSTCVHQGLIGGKPELIPEIVRRGLNSLVRGHVSDSYTRCCFLFVEPDELAGTSEQDKSKWRPNNASTKKLYQSYKQMYAYLKTQLKVDWQKLPSNLLPMFVRMPNYKIEGDVEKEMEKRIEEKLFPNFKYKERTYRGKRKYQQINGVKKEMIHPAFETEVKLSKIESTYGSEDHLPPDAPRMTGEIKP